ncbi:hypothetical protein BDZ97DRAFT_586758 [Flammula alnicola]|nr:hypothetical protein BDZ97DRAFT_586758 [Flammula alnicola]
MNTKEPPRPKTILATPINVEESRAQRLQRSQARFRDRGGIFVPTNRNTLADILLGKASPLKKPRRSVSASPLHGKGISVTNTRRVSSPQKLNATVRTVSRSPQKRGMKSTQGGGDKEPIVATDNDEEPAKKAVAAKASKSKAKRGSKAAPKAAKAKPTAKTRKAETTDQEDERDGDEAPAKGKAKTKAARKTSEDREEHGGRDVPLAKSKAKSRTVRKTTSNSTSSKPSEESDETEKPKTKIRKRPKTTSTTSSVNAASAAKDKRSRSRKSDLYSGASEDEYVPKAPMKPSAPKSNANRPIADKAKLSSSTKSTATAPPKQSRAGPSNLPDIPEEDEEEEDLPLVEIEAPQRRLSAKAPKAETTKKSPSKGKKRVVQEAEVSQEPSQPPRKRLKASEKEAAISSLQDPKPKVATREKTSKKRSRDQDESVSPEEADKRFTKRKKPLSEKDPVSEDGEEKSEPKTTNGKSRSKKPTTTVGKLSSGKPTKTARKENTSALKQPEPPANVAPRRGPPKSVLQRLKDSEPQVVDNEPDPIDFLS